MKTCEFCGESALISSNIGACVNCAQKLTEKVEKQTQELHAQTRRRFGLPTRPPNTPDGLSCNGCLNLCKMGQGDVGFCGLVKNIENSLTRIAGDDTRGLLSWYFDPNPTNCCASWVCPAGTGCGFPDFANKKGPELGYMNLAVFYGACNFNCLFCQNSHFKELFEKKSLTLYKPKDLVDNIDKKVSCICYFGGDPTPQMIHSIKTSELALIKAKENKQILRICWETNGGMNWKFLNRASDLALSSGGCIKIDLKCYDENLHRTLCGVSNKQTIENFRRLGQRFEKRPEIPLLIGTTLLIPGYIDEDEVRKIARMIASINPEIPYALLGFHPHFYMKDLPRTSKIHAQRCQKVAKSEGLQNVNIGNPFLLSDATY